MRTSSLLFRRGAKGRGEAGPAAGRPGRPRAQPLRGVAAVGARPRHARDCRPAPWQSGAAVGGAGAGTVREVAPRGRRRRGVGSATTGVRGRLRRSTAGRGAHKDRRPARGRPDDAAGSGAPRGGARPGPAAEPDPASPGPDRARARRPAGLRRRRPRPGVGKVARGRLAAVAGDPRARHRPPSGPARAGGLAAALSDVHPELRYTDSHIELRSRRAGARSTWPGGG